MNQIQMPHVFTGPQWEKWLILVAMKQLIQVPITILERLILAFRQEPLVLLQLIYIVVICARQEFYILQREIICAYSLSGIPYLVCHRV